MSKRTDEELIKVVTIDREDYDPLAVAAAEEEIENRNLDAVKIEQVENEVKTELAEKKQVDDKAVSSLIRFIHFIIDTVVWFTIAVILIDLTLHRLFNNHTLSWLLLFAIFIGYYYIMEVCFQKTVAKFITKTKVVTNNGSKPSKSDILIRTLCRLIPFDRVSFLFIRNGIHDKLSGTRVVKDERNYE